MDVLERLPKRQGVAALFTRTFLFDPHTTPPPKFLEFATPSQRTKLASTLSCP